MSAEARAAAAALRVERVDPSRWVAACTAQADAGRGFASLHAAHGPDGAPELRALFGDPAGGHVLLAAPALPGVDGAKAWLPSLVERIGAAHWDEREAHDLFRVRFAGHEPLRPLVAHDLDLASWTVPVAGEDVYQVAVGPIHAGVIESGHFRFHLVGERIIHLDVRLFYKHRGLEAAAAGRTPEQGLAIAQRACAACTVTNTVAYAQAWEAILGLAPSDDLARARTLTLELERLYNHLYDIGALCAGVGFAPGNMAFLALKERAQRVCAQLAGHRFLFGTVGVGEGRLAIDAEGARAAREEIRSIQAAAHRAWRAVLFNGSVQDRLDLVGVVTREDALRLGTCGPAGRASGVDRDVRAESPLLHYPGFRATRPDEPAGDVQRRLELRAAELPATFALLDELLAGPLPAGAAVRVAEQGAGPGAGVTPGGGVLAAARVESPRGETACVVEAAPDGTIARLHLRSGSYRNWPSAGHAAAGELLPDFPLINKSFELCYACADR